MMNPNLRKCFKKGSDPLSIAVRDSHPIRKGSDPFLKHFLSSVSFRTVLFSLCLVAMSSFMPVAVADDATVVTSQPPSMTLDDRYRGHVFVDPTTWFVFDESLYNLRPDRVVVTGEFRGWSQDMDDAAWHLRRVSPKSRLWMLAVANANGATIGPSTPFKFRVDDGDWIAPPALSPNQDGGNLIHRPGVQPVKFRAEILADGSITASLRGQTLADRLNPQTYRLTNAAGQSIAIGDVRPIDEATVSITAEETIDPKRVYYLAVHRSPLKTLCRRDGWMRHLHSDKALGANVDPDGKRTTWRLFAPRAEAVNVYLYRGADDETPFETLAMDVDEDGVWEVSIDGDWHGVYYDLTVHGPADPGNFFYQTHPVHISDPYARVSVDSFGKCRVWRATTPATPLKNGRPPMQDVVAYEVHIEDFTNRLPVDDDLKGTLPAMVTPGLVNRHGHPIGLDYLVDLGVNVVHLMPVQEFLHYPDDVWQDAFADDPFMIDAGVHLTNYQWGYRTTHAFAIETRYRRSGTEHGAQRDQFRDLVQSFHDRGIAVIIDLVPNHTGENMDGRHHLFGFNVIDLPYYHRTNDRVEHIGPYGNEIKTEDRPMVRRWLVDQCQHMIDEFGIDGFRIDLAGQIDKQTLIHLRQQLSILMSSYTANRGSRSVIPTWPKIRDTVGTKRTRRSRSFKTAPATRLKGPDVQPAK
jgi:pullulanase